MYKKWLALIICVSMFFCLVSCGKNEAIDSNNESSNTIQAETNNTPQSETDSDETTCNETSTESTNDIEITIVPDETTLTPEETTNAPIETTLPTEETETIIIQTPPVFGTENITRITFYAYNGMGIGSDVPSENMAEIINWLDTFKVTSKKLPEITPPGTNTIHVEIKYSDGTVIKHGLCTATVDGIEYYMIHDPEPECYWEILSHTSLS